jgi:hypothetical protein
MVGFIRAALVMSITFSHVDIVCCLLTDHPMQYVSICAAVRDETMDLREWVDYHYMMGISKIYLMDHGSKTPLINSLVSFDTFGLFAHDALVAD